MAIALPRPLRMERAITARVIADALMVSAAFLLAMVLEFEWFVFVVHVQSEQQLLTYFVQSFVTSVWALLAISLSIFALSGFYTRGRAYTGRYKALIVAQAVSLSYLCFAFLSYLLPGLLVVPRAALVGAWVITLVMLVGARLWSQIWDTVVRTEQRTISAQVAATNVKQVLVIGGAGYIGSALLPQLLDKGYRVRLLDMLLFGNEPISNVLGHPRLEIIQADFRHVDQVVEAMRGVDAVIHLGAIVGDPACAIDEDLTIEVNLMATRMIAEVAKGSGVKRFIFASTCSVYGASDQVLDEHSELNPVSLYARSKIASERVLLQMANAHFTPTILRFGTIYGLSGRTRFDLVVNLLTAKAVMEHMITVFGGDQWRPFVHVNDAATAVFKVLEAPQGLVRNEIFNVGSNEQNYTIQQVGEMILRLVPDAQLISKGSDSDRRNYRVNFNKIRNLLDFKPQWTLERGIRQVMEAIRRGDITDYRDVKYCNTKSLTEGISFRRINRNNGWVHELLNETMPGHTVINDTTPEPALATLEVGR